MQPINNDLVIHWIHIYWMSMGCHNPRPRGNRGKYSCPLSVYIPMGMCVITNKWKHPLVISTNGKRNQYKVVRELKEGGGHHCIVSVPGQPLKWNGIWAESRRNQQRERAVQVSWKSSKQREQHPWGKRIQVQIIERVWILFSWKREVIGRYWVDEWHDLT